MCRRDRNDATLILKDEVGTADEDSLLIDGACDAMSHQILQMCIRDSR